MKQDQSEEDKDSTVIGEEEEPICKEIKDRMILSAGIAKGSDMCFGIVLVFQDKTIG